MNASLKMIATATLLLCVPTAMALTGAACGDDVTFGNPTGGGGHGAGYIEPCVPYLEPVKDTVCSASCPTNIRSVGVDAHYCTLPCGETSDCPDLHQCVPGGVGKTCLLICGNGCPTGMSCGGSFCQPGEPVE